MFIDILKDTILDCLKMLPFLLAAYFLIELIERKQSEKLEKILRGAGKFGFIPGALLGLIPQCGFSGMAADLFTGNVITLGTLVAVFISTSDEAIPLLLANPDRWTDLVKLLIFKFIAAIIAGIAVDILIKNRSGYRGNIHEIDCHDHNENESIIIAAIRHTAVIMASIFVILLLLNIATEYIGQDYISAFIGRSGAGQIFLAGLVGMIPNCASSVLLTQMYAADQISFAAMFAGLCSGSGIGTLVLINTEKNKRKALAVLALVYCISVIFGIIIWVA